MHDVTESLRQFIRRNFLFDSDAQFSDDDSLLDSGVIDSTGVLELIALLEKEYGIELRDEELVPENLDTINNLVRFIVTKREYVEVLA